LKSEERFTEPAIRLRKNEIEMQNDDQVLKEILSGFGGPFQKYLNDRF
jgi:hypothetical protein